MIKYVIAGLLLITFISITVIYSYLFKMCFTALFKHIKAQNKDLKAVRSE